MKHRPRTASTAPGPVVVVLTWKGMRKHTIRKKRKKPLVTHLQPPKTIPMRKNWTKTLSNPLRTCQVPTYLVTAVSEGTKLCVRSRSHIVGTVLVEEAQTTGGKKTTETGHGDCYIPVLI